MTGACKARQAIVGGPLGVQVLAHRRNSVPAIDTSRMAQHRLLVELQGLHETAGVLVVDIGSGHSPWTKRFSRAASLVVLVTTTEDLALLDCYAAIKRSASEGIDTPVYVLANKCDSETIAAEVYARLSTACRRFLSRSVRSLPPLPTNASSNDVHAASLARVWEDSNSLFGRSTLWLGRAVSDILHETVRRTKNDSSGRPSAADNVRHHPGTRPRVKLAEMQQV
jgi:MinD-like ATPase involved in chromosome partitioning or flagellar assembly